MSTFSPVLESIVIELDSALDVRCLRVRWRPLEKGARPSEGSLSVSASAFHWAAVGGLVAALLRLKVLAKSGQCESNRVIELFDSPRPSPAASCYDALKSISSTKGPRAWLIDLFGEHGVNHFLKTAFPSSQFSKGREKRFEIRCDLSVLDASRLVVIADEGEASLDAINEALIRWIKLNQSQTDKGKPRWSSYSLPPLPQYCPPREEIPDVLLNWHNRFTTNPYWSQVPLLLHGCIPVADVFTELYLLPSGDVRRMRDTPYQEYDAAMDSKFQRSISIESILARIGSRMVFVGAPGGGKSTLVRWIVDQIISNPILGFESAVIIPLRDLSNSFERNQVSSVWEYVVHRLAGVAKASSANEAIALCKRYQSPDTTNRLLFLFDGWDEVPHNQREWILQAIDSETAGMPVIMTTRPSGIPAQIAQQADHVFTIGRLDPASGRKLVESLCTRLDRAALAHTILNHIDRNPSVAGLATNPYVMTLITEMGITGANDDGVPLPVSGAELFSRGVELIQKDHNRKAGLPRLDRPELERLETLAGYLCFGQADKRVTFQARDLAEESSTKLDASSLGQCRLITKFSENVDDYFFVHLRFQEFFAARNFNANDENEKLRRLNVYWADWSRLEEWKFAAGRESPGSSFWQFWTDRLRTPDRFRGVFVLVAALLAESSVNDGGTNHVGQDIRPTLWEMIESRVWKQSAIDAFLALDPIGLKSRLQGMEETDADLLVTVFKRMTIPMRIQCGFDMWVEHDVEVRFLRGLPSSGYASYSDMGRLRSLFRDTSLSIRERQGSLQMLSAVRDRGLIPIVQEQIWTEDYSMFQDMVGALGRIGGREAAMVLAETLIGEALNGDPESGRVFPLIDALRISGHGALEAYSRDLLLHALQEHPNSDAVAHVVLASFSQFPLGPEASIVLGILRSDRAETLRTLAADALGNCPTPEIVQAAIEHAKMETLPDIRVAVLRAFRQRNILLEDNFDWLFQSAFDTKEGKRFRTAALEVLISSVVGKAQREAVSARIKAELEQLHCGVTSSISSTAIDGAHLVDTAPELLLQVAETRSLDVTTRQEAVAALTKIGAPSVATRLVKLLGTVNDPLDIFDVTITRAILALDPIVVLTLSPPGKKGAQLAELIA